MTEQGPFSLRAYARHRGCSLKAVQRAIAAERLKASVVTVDGVPKITGFDLADQEWAANTDSSKVRVPPADDGEELLEDEEDSPFRGAAARERHYKALRQQVAYEKEIGELVNAAEMQAQIADTFSTVRTKLLGVPSKVKQQHPELTRPVLAAIDAAVREALEELTNGGDQAEGAA